MAYSSDGLLGAVLLGLMLATPAGLDCSKRRLMYKVERRKRLFFRSARFADTEVLFQLQMEALLAVYQLFLHA